MGLHRLSESAHKFAHNYDVQYAALYTSSRYLDLTSMS